MTRKNIMVSEEVHSMLKDKKEKGDTFDDVLRKMFDIPPYHEDGDGD
jgi:predicted CopG family antitoxin